MVSSKIADRLQKLVSTGAPDRAAPIHVFLHNELSPQERAAAERGIRDIATTGSLEYLTSLNALVGAVPLEAVGRIAELPEVFWMDLDSRAPLGELLDLD